LDDVLQPKPAFVRLQQMRERIRQHQVRKS
jgi:hypothetical protein